VIRWCSELATPIYWRLAATSRSPIMSSSHAALIVDADPKGLESLAYGFQGADWRITACPTPETASLLVGASGAEIVIIASRADHEKAYAMIRQIRGKETLRTLPLLVLGPEELRKPLKENGDVDLLPLPTFVRDVLTASQLMVDVGMYAAKKPGEEPSFALPMAAATTMSMIRTLCGLARSGVLQLERKGRHGEILFHAGEVTAAQTGQLQGMAAIQHVLIWNDGTLKVLLRPVARRGQLHQTTHEFLDEFDRFQRDYAHAMKDIGPPSTVYSKSEERLSHSTGAVPAEVTPVVRLCDGQRTLSDIIDESPFRVLDTVRIVGRLVELAIFVRRDPKPLGAQAPRAPLEEFWETARIAGLVSPRAPRARGESTPQATPAPHAPASEVAQTATSTEAHPTGAVPAAAMPANSSPGAITAPLAGLPIVETKQELDANVPKIATSGTQASGTIELRERKAQSGVRPAHTRKSVVLDIAQIETANAALPAVVLTSVVQTPAIQTSPVQQNPTAAESAGSLAARIAGEIEVSPSRKTARQMPAQARMSIQLDATLSPEPGAPLETPPSGKAARGDKRHQSGSFSPIEKDFFEREAELYKVEGTESFADLDENRSKAAGKTGPGKKPGKAHRK
jgi:hypothetical protein